MKKALFFTLMVCAAFMSHAQSPNGPSSPFGSGSSVAPTTTSAPASSSYVAIPSSSSSASTFPLDRNTAYNNYNNGGVNNASNLSRHPRLNFSDRNSPWIGSRYYRDTAFHQGELRTRKGLLSNESSYRYDQIVGAIEVKLEDDKTMYLYDKDVLYCKLFFDKHTTVFVPMVLPNEQQPTLIEVVYKTPTLQLYRNLQKANNPSAVYTGSPDLVDKSKNDYQFYFRTGDKQPVKEVSITSKSFINLLPNKKHYIIELFKAQEGKGKLTLAKLSEMMKKLDEKEEEQ
jgi:hypothetical protein